MTERSELGGLGGTPIRYSEVMNLNYCNNGMLRVGGKRELIPNHGIRRKRLAFTNGTVSATRWVSIEAVEPPSDNELKSKVIPCV